MADRTVPTPPAGLQAAGKRLWREICVDLPASMEFDRRELAILADACRQADVNASLQRAIRRDGLMIKGAAGQRRLNAAVTELRQGRIALARLLDMLDMAEQQPATGRSRRASRAAQSRWKAHNDRRVEQERIREGVRRGQAS